MKNFKDSKLTEIMPKMFKKIQQPENNKRKPIQKYSKSNKKRQGQKHNPIKTVILITYLFQMSNKDSFFFSHRDSPNVISDSMSCPVDR